MSILPPNYVTPPDSHYTPGNRSLEATIKKHAGSGGGTAAFTGEGRTLGGSTPAGPAATGTEGVTNIDPQVKLLGLFLGVYLLYWFFK